MEYFYVVMLRILHVGVGMFWAGADIYVAAFVLPAVKASGPEGGRFMQVLVKTNRLAFIMDAASAITLVSGLLLYVRMSSGFQTEWITSRYGTSLTVGGLAALTSYIIGFTVNRPTVGRMARIGKEIEAAGGPPSPQQQAELAALQKRLTTALNTIALLLAGAVIAMSVARYV